MKLLYRVLFIAVLAVSAVAYAQDQGQSTPQQQKQQPSDAPRTSITGCLTKGTADGNYTIADQTSGEKISFNAPAQIDRFLNQTVKLTGTVSGTGAAKVFTPESISQVSPSCAKAQ